MAQKKSRLSQRHDRMFCATMCSLVHVMCTSNNSDPLERKSEPVAAAGTARSPLGYNCKVEGRVDSWGAPATCRCDVRRRQCKRAMAPGHDSRLSVSCNGRARLSCIHPPVPRTHDAPAGGQIAWPRSRSPDDDDSTARVQARRRRPRPLP